MYGVFFLIPSTSKPFERVEFIFASKVLINLFSTILNLNYNLSVLLLSYLRYNIFD